MENENNPVEVGSNTSGEHISCWMESSAERHGPANFPRNN